MADRKWSPGIAAVLSFFIPGVGQIYKRQILGGFVWMAIIGALYTFPLTALIIASFAKMSSNSTGAFMAVGIFLVPILGGVFHLACIIGAATGDTSQYTSGKSWAALLLVVIFACGIAGYLERQDVKIPESIPVQSRIGPSPTNHPIDAPTDTHCGHPNHKPSSVESVEKWRTWKCVSRSETDVPWGACLSRSEYTWERGMGCPGSERCCPHSTLKQTGETE